MIGPNQVPTKIKQIGYNSMHGHESLRLFY